MADSKKEIRGERIENYAIELGNFGGRVERGKERGHCSSRKAIRNNERTELGLKIGN